MLTFSGHAEEVQTSVLTLQKWTLRLMEGKLFAGGCMAGKQQPLRSSFQVPGPAPGLRDVEGLALTLVLKPSRVNCPLWADPAVSEHINSRS